MVKRSFVAPVLFMLAIVIIAETKSVAAASITLQMPTRIDLQRHDLHISGEEAVQVRIDFGVGASAPKHRHPGDELVYVLEGSLEYQIEGRQAIVLGPQDVLFIPAGLAHSVRNAGRVKSSELATYVVDKGKSLLELIK